MYMYIYLYIARVCGGGGLVEDVGAAAVEEGAVRSLLDRVALLGVEGHAQHGHHVVQQPVHHL